MVNDAVTAANRIEDTYKTHGAAAAAAALRQDYEKSLDPTSQATLKAETARIQQDNPNILPHLALEWAKPEVQGDRLTQSRLSDMAMFAGAVTPTNKGQADISFAGDMAAQLSQHYAQFNEGNWSNGIDRSDINRWEGRYDQTQQDSNMASQLLSKDAGGTTLMQKIAGVNGLSGETAQSTLQTALDRDKAHQFMTPEQRQAVQYLHDHWTDSATRQLSQDGYTMTEDSLNNYAKKNGVHPAEAPQPPAAPAAPADANAGQHPAGGDPQAGQHPAGGDPHAGQHPAGGDPQAGQHPAGGDPQAGQHPASVHAEKGAGYWDIAAQELGLESSDSTKGTLQQRRAAMNKNHLTPEQHHQLYTLMQELEAAGHGPLNGQAFNFNNANGTITFKRDAGS